ncbi:hydroxypyruvate isomerase family protein [Aliiglaciecola lipolytica]|uniref:Hydroxypyruvate isomerase n=1 Tax=Aliiglaciecola lipolytica E3 TaxID=1127673 RepID=K6YU67_9ALTE|nr:TIM barrel protein [Aliiglaciecola lipolytica]GAC14795.1 hydroxypyruvate isomerase [Aliiglaciecola lipolytica E3]
MAISRRNIIKGALLTSAALATQNAMGRQQHSEDKSKTLLKGNINHSVSRWTYGHLSIEELCQLVKTLGFNAIDLVGPKDWPILKQYNIDSSMCNGAELNLVDGWIHPQFHAELTQRYLKHIDLVADAGYKNLVCFSGNARGMSPEQGLKNATVGLQKVIPHAEKRGVILQMELFNSKVNHPDYMADNSKWGIELCKRLNSQHFKLLYDIYHMQVNEGDVIRTITDNHQYFGHYHTAGVPGRNEIDETQELYYPAIAKAILKTGFNGYLAQEFIPTPKSNEGKAESLQQAIAICDV